MAELCLLAGYANLLLLGPESNNFHSHWLPVGSYGQSHKSDEPKQGQTHMLVHHHWNFTVHVCVCIWVVIWVLVCENELDSLPANDPERKNRATFRHSVPSTVPGFRYLHPAKNYLEHLQNMFDGLPLVGTQKGKAAH